MGSRAVRNNNNSATKVNELTVISSGSLFALIHALEAADALPLPNVKEWPLREGSNVF